MKKVTKKNFTKIVTKILESYQKEDNDGKSVWCDSINTMLTELRNDDFFGTEGQMDPRGDGRDDIQ
jgi:hypothetical protein